jgi:polar amino acid transport system substrate-binding protein
MKKRVISVILAVAMSVCAISACSGSKQKTDVGLLDSGILKIGMEIGYPPFEMYSDDGVTPIGLDVDLATEIANILGVEVEFENSAWDGIFNGLNIDKYDAVISAVTINGERKETMDFSEPYIENWQSIAVLKGSNPVTSPQGLEGLRVGYQEATTSAEYLSDLIASGQVSCETFEYAKVMNVFDDLRLGRLDAAICDSVVSEGYVTKEPDLFEISWLQKDDEGAEAETFGVAVKKGNTKLVEAINKAIEELKENGKLNDILSDWLS